MHKRLALLIPLIILSATGCNPQPLPVAPTPIPTLAPATLPVEAEATTAPQATPTTGGEDRSTGTGAQVFEQNCSACHNLTAEAKVGPGLAGLFGKDALPNGDSVNEENLKGWIRNGGGAMPGFLLPDDQLEVLISFMRDATQ
jgi:mono/diheme cytochrome c family protein